MPSLAAEGEMRRSSTLFITAWHLGSERPVEGVSVREHALAVTDRGSIVRRVPHDGPGRMAGACETVDRRLVAA
jgi:hypothetical protein